MSPPSSSRETAKDRQAVSFNTDYEAVRFDRGGALGRHRGRNPSRRGQGKRCRQVAESYRAGPGGVGAGDPFPPVTVRENGDFVSFGVTCGRFVLSFLPFFSRIRPIALPNFAASGYHILMNSRPFFPHSPFHR